MELLKEMETIVNSQVEYFKDDFFSYDIPALKSTTEKSFFWIVRKCGTNLIKCNGDLVSLDYYIRYGENIKGFYILDLEADSIKKVDPVEIPKIKEYTVSFKNYNNIFNNRKMSIKAFNMGGADVIARKLFDQLGSPDNFTHYEIMEA